jgi:hypothetical protein
MSLEIFVDSIKGALDTAMSVHYSFAVYSKWTVDYMLKPSLLPPGLNHHPNYTTMCINYNTYCQFLFRYFHPYATIRMTSFPSAYYDLTPFIIKCGWQLLQE